MPENVKEGTRLVFEGGLDKVEDLDKVNLLISIYYVRPNICSNLYEIYIHICRNTAHNVKYIVHILNIATIFDDMVYWNNGFSI